MTKTKWCVIQNTKTKSEFAVKINTDLEIGKCVNWCKMYKSVCFTSQQPKKTPVSLYGINVFCDVVM